MIKCSHKQANMFVGRQADRYILITSQMDREDGAGDKNGLNSTCLERKIAHFMQQMVGFLFFSYYTVNVTGILLHPYQ